LVHTFIPVFLLCLFRLMKLLYSFPPFLDTIEKKDLKEFVEISIQVRLNSTIDNVKEEKNNWTFL